MACTKDAQEIKPADPDIPIEIPNHYVIIDGDTIGADGGGFQIPDKINARNH